MNSALVASLDLSVAPQVGAIISPILPASRVTAGDAPDFVEVGEAGIAVGDAMRRRVSCSTRWMTYLD